MKKFFCTISRKVISLLMVAFGVPYKAVPELLFEKRHLIPVLEQLPIGYQKAPE